MSDTCETCKGDKAITVKTHSSEELIKDCPDCTEPAPSARVEVLLGMDRDELRAMIVSITNELLQARARIAALEAGVRKWASECGECDGDGTVGVVRSVVGGEIREHPIECGQCADIRALLPAKEQGEAR